MGRPYNLPEPLAGLAEKAGGEARLQEIMGNVPNSTFHRWKALINTGKTLPRSAISAISIAQEKLQGAKK